MPHTTIDDRLRKSRIHAREDAAFFRHAAKIEKLTEAELTALRKTLNKIKTASDKDEPVMASTLKNWADLRKLGVVWERDGKAHLTQLGAAALDPEA